MRVVRATEFGGPEVLAPSEAVDPEPGSAEALIGVSDIEVLFIDTQLRRGWGHEYFALEPPYVPGTGVTGTVLDVGEDVDPDWVGKRVVTRTGDTGAYVERFVASPRDLFEVPDSVGPDVALAALHDGPTALSRFEKSGIEAGSTVLVTAASGGLATWLLPLAHASGAYVVAAANGESKLERARGLGADTVVDYGRPRWEERLAKATDGARVDVVFDGAGGTVGTAAFDLVAPGSRFFAYGAASGDFAAIDPDDASRLGVTVVPITDAITDEDQRRLTRRALDLMADGTITPVIGQSVPLTQAADAHAAIEARRVIGKTVLTV